MSKRWTEFNELLWTVSKTRTGRKVNGERELKDLFGTNGGLSSDFYLEKNTYWKL